MPIRVAHHTLSQNFPGTTVIDVTSRGPQPWVRLSPFYPHGGVPVPFTEGVTSQSVEGIWQGLKVFQNADVDPARMQIATMFGLRRTRDEHGPLLGHRAGLHGTELLPPEAARRRIYLPAYRWMLEHRVPDLVERLADLSRSQEVILLDFYTNGDVADTTASLSHAALISLYLEGRWPSEN